ncbi:MAG: hypothetical protein ACLPXM_11915 [Terriglobales bacterium]
MALNEALNRLASFVNNLKFGSLPKFESEQNKQISGGTFVIVSRADWTILLAGDDAAEYREIVDELHRGIAKTGHLSKRAVERLTEDFFFGLFATGDRRSEQGFPLTLQDRLHQFKQSLLEGPKSWEIHLPVGGLDPRGLPLAVGKVEFYFFDRPRSEVLASCLADSARTNPEERAKVAVDLSAELAGLVDKTVARVVVSGVDFDAACEKAKATIRVTIDTINFYTPRAHLLGWLYLTGEVFPQVELVPGFAHGVGAHIGRSWRGPIYPIPLNQIASRPGFVRASKMLSMEQPKDLEKRILASMQWAGRAQVDDRREEAFLFYAIALETLLLGRETTGEITYQLATRCANLLGSPGLNQRRAVVRHIKELYRLRSKIVHSGSLEVTDASLGRMRDYAVSSLFIVLEHDPFKSMLTVREFDDWFEGRLLSGGLSEAEP